jgi:hypothetical protein
MNRIQKAIILSWLIVIGVVICLYLEWRFAASIMLWPWFYIRGNHLNEKENCRKYFSNRKGQMIFCIIAMILPFLWFLYRMVSDPNMPENAWIVIGLPFVPFIIMMITYDRWLYLNNDCKVSPRYNQDTNFD